MGNVRIIPVLLLNRGGLYKTIKFKNPKYIGDPINSVKIFNEKEADELLLLDYRASIERRDPDYEKIAEIAGEAFMPMAYGGGIRHLENAKRVFSCGYEKVVLNTILFDDLNLIERIASIYGAQAVVGCIDFTKSFFKSNRAYSYSGTKKSSFTPLQWAKNLENAGVGEIIVNSIDNDGTWKGYSLEIISEISQNVKVPVIACGGAGRLEDFEAAVRAGASAVAAGSMFVFQKKGLGVLISFPSDLQIPNN